MKKIHDVYFPRYDDDVVSERRTLFHLPVGDRAWTAGDSLRLLASPRFPRCKTGVLIDVRQARLCSEIDADLAKLCAADRAAYLASWDVLHPGLPSAADPTVLRIEFRYGAWEADPTDSPEWSLAS